jgi:hypothetical protein
MIIKSKAVSLKEVSKVSYLGTSNVKVYLLMAPRLAVSKGLLSETIMYKS